MNIAVIGYGYWGKNLVRNFDKLGVLHTICDTDTEAACLASSLYPNVAFTASYASILADREVNGVVIATPSSTHYSMAKQALLANKDVFVEKPLTLSTKDAEELVALSAERQRVLLVGHLMLYHPAIQLLRKYIHEGELGEIHYLYSTRVNLGQVRCDENVLWRLAPHDISILIYLLDRTPSVISARGFSYIQPCIADIVFALLDFGGVVAHVQVSWLDPHRIRQLTVVGSRGMAVFDDTEAKHKLKIHHKGIEKADLSVRSGETVSPQISTTEILAIECTDFVNCMGSRKQPLSGAELGLKVTTVLEAISKVMHKESK